METILMSELASVNLMLETIGEQPIASLLTSGSADVAIAIRTLQEESRAVQEKGWSFNSENEVAFIPDTDGQINLGTDILRADRTYEDSECECIVRGTRLYNKSDRTYIFTETIYLNIVTFLAWEDLPSMARSYIAIRAARKFHQKVFGSDTIQQYTENDEYAALAAMQEHEADVGDYNILANQPALQRTTVQ